ncbi:MAG: glutathione S-transferase family protein [Pseudomonadota bacterium]|jgi:Predicted glutathione S-transferase|nr:MAG: glutathione-dependent reductase [Pseudomonadota bacterium]
MGMLIDGQWRSEASYADPRSGAFQRRPSTYRARVSADGSTGFPAEANRYHLYVARACPWSHRTMIFRVLKKLEDVISISYLEPAMLENGWTFREPDPLTGARYLYEVYQRADPRYTGRATVPVLWDKRTGTIVNNESSDIVRMLNSEFNAFTDDRTDYYPAELAAEIDALNARIYETVNNGVYRAGFAARQEAYESAVRTLFESLDWLEALLSRQRYLLGDRLTEADWRLFPTLVRFDAVYYGHFKCNLRHVYEYPALWAYTRELYQIPGIAATVAIDEYKAHYYGSHRHINPSGIVPLGPVLDFSLPHGRDRL